MFDFEKPEDGSEARYHARLKAWQEGREFRETPTATMGVMEDVGAPKPEGVGPLPTLRYRAWWVLHNVVAHPLIGILPCHETFEFHDWTSRCLIGAKR